MRPLPADVQGATAGPGDSGRPRRLTVSWHRVGLELLRLALQDAGSPYLDAVDPVCLTLPALPGRDRDTVLALARQGPPGEDVGLDPYREAFAPPEYMGARPAPTPQAGAGR